MSIYIHIYTSLSIIYIYIYVYIYIYIHMYTHYISAGGLAIISATYVSEVSLNQTANTASNTQHHIVCVIFET